MFTKYFSYRPLNIQYIRSQSTDIVRMPVLLMLSIESYGCPFVQKL